MQEVWKAVPGYEGLYEVSTRGRVRSLPRNTTRGKVLKAAENDKGYLFVVFSKNNERKLHYVHKLVARTFIGMRKVGQVIRHMDGNQRNNSVENLKYGTNSENNLDKVRHGTHHEANKTQCPYGHAYSKQNTYYRPSGKRFCRECGRQRSRAYKAGQRGHCEIS